LAVGLDYQHFDGRCGGRNSFTNFEDNLMAQYIEPFPASTRGDEFGNLAPYREGRPHRGQDWSPKAGTIIPAITNGAIKKNEWSDGLGWFIIQSTADDLFVLYAHLEAQPNLSIGHYIHMGDSIGKVGNTGKFTTGAHLHLSIASSKNVHLCPHDKLVNPLTHIAANPAPKKVAPKGKKK
jgi:murein DD-endopeptidase MepM/ murein hydrolase activator NlpD